MARKTDAFDKTLKTVSALDPSARAELCRRVLVDMLGGASDDDAVRAAESVLSADYFKTVRSIAVDVVKQPEDEQGDRLHEAIDGNAFVIYTHMARRTLLCSENPEACEDETGEKPETVEQAAYWAMMADVRRLLSNRYFLADHAKGDEPSADE
jgi:hypothetical protein